MLAGDARITAAQTVKSYSDFKTAHVSTIVKAPTNRSGVDYVVVASGAHKSGYTQSPTLLLRHDDGRWVVVNAGQDLSY